MYEVLGIEKMVLVVSDGSERLGTMAPREKKSPKASGRSQPNLHRFSSTLGVSTGLEAF